MAGMTGDGGWRETVDAIRRDGVRCEVVGMVGMRPEREGIGAGGGESGNGFDGNVGAGAGASTRQHIL